MGKNFAICIGVNKYNYLKNLGFAKRDAELMKDYFLKEANFEKVYYFAEDALPIKQDYGNDLEASPHFTNLMRFLRIRFEKPFLSSGDNFWFFFAGHGLRYQERDYLMPGDADPGNVGQTSISINYVAERLRCCGAGNVILFIDACRDQGCRNGLGIGSERPKGVITIFSCSPNESSYEIEELRQGSFTHVLLTAFRLQGEENCATVERLDDYLLNNVPALNQKYRKPSQTPYTIVEPRIKSHFVLLPKQATDLDILILKEDAKDAELEGNFEQAEDLWKRVLAIQPSDQSAFKGLERIWSNSRLKNVKPEAKKPRDLETGTDVTLHTNSDDGLKPNLSPSTSTSSSRLSVQIVRLNDKGEELEYRKNQVICYVEDLGSRVSLELVSISGGSFLMGSLQGERGRTKREEPQHNVVIKPFWLGRYPITQIQWNAVSFLPKVNQELETNPANFKGKDRPVECVSWCEAIEFCERLSRYTGRKYRLPSESEWEYACRATTTTPFHFGETIRTAEANYHGDYRYGHGSSGEYRQSTNVVQEFTYTNIFGLSDMHGNVLEWCQDVWHENYNGAPTDGIAWTTGGDSSSRVTRGGSWSSDPIACRSAYRNQANINCQDDALGFRVAVSIL